MQLVKTIFIRIDKIGDLIATLPVDQHPSLKEKNISSQWVIAKGLGFLPTQASPPRQFFELDPKDEKVSRKKLIEFLCSEKPDAVVTFYAPWWVNYACWKAGVPLRIGRKSQWHSFLFLNRGLRQSRSLAEKHEADYNRELVEYGLQLPIAPTPTLKLDPPVIRRLFEKFEIKNQDYVVVHPGMFGSALNWPQSRYNELIEKLTEKTTVVITGTKNDDPYHTEIRPKWEHHARVRYLQDKLNFEELLSVLKTSKGVVAPSTGVLHLAASLEVPCVGLFSPIREHSAVRWGPRGSHAIALTPQSEMNEISADQVLKALKL